MSRQDMIHACEDQVQELLPDLPRPEQKALAALVTGVVLSEQATLRVASAATPGVAHDTSKQRRAQRLLANARLDLGRAHRRLAARVLSSRHGRVDLLLDATTTGATAKQAGTVTLCFAVAWQRRAVPLVWRTWTANAPGQGWQAAIRELVAVLQAVVPADAQVVVLADRGLSGGPLAQLCVALGWHFLLRVTRCTRVRRSDGTVCQLRDLVPQPGARCCLHAVTLYAPRHKQRHAAGGWVSDWQQGLVAQVVAVWRRQDEEAWLVVTDLPATFARCYAYRRRTWQEELFRDLKGMGWQWQRSRVRRPERVARSASPGSSWSWPWRRSGSWRWPSACCAAAGGRGWRPRREARSRRCYSVFQLGLHLLRRCLATDQPVPVTFHLWSARAAPLKLS